MDVVEDIRKNGLFNEINVSKIFYFMFLLFIIQNLVEFQRILMLIGKVSHFGVSVASFRGRLVTFEVKVVEIGVKVASHFSPNCPCPHYTAVKLDTKKPWGKLRQRRCNPLFFFCPR